MHVCVHVWVGCGRKMGDCVFQRYELSSLLMLKRCTHNPVVARLMRVHY